MENAWIQREGKISLLVERHGIKKGLIRQHKQSKNPALKNSLMD